LLKLNYTAIKIVSQIFKKIFSKKILNKIKTGLFAVDIVNKPTNLSPYSDLNSQETNSTRSSNNKINPVSLPEN